MSKDTYWIAVDVKRKTAKAALLSDSATEAWVPLSQIIDSSDDLIEGRTVEVELPAWLAEEKGFIA